MRYISPRMAFGVLALAASASLMLASSGPSAEADLRSAIRSATGKFKDLTMDVKIKNANQKELAVIGKDYGKAYEFENSSLYFKAPDKFKMTSRAGLVNVSYIITGDIKRIRAGLIKKTQDISDDPHKKQTVLDVGVVNDSLWREFDVAFLRTERSGGRAIHVLSLALANSPSKKQYIFVDGADYRLLKREKREADGSLRVRYVYSNHKKYAGVVWIPGEVKVYNKNGKLGGTSVYGNIRVNTGLKDSIFQ